MSHEATYSGDPSTSERDRLRSFVGDIDMDEPLMLDAELDFILEGVGDDFDQAIGITLDRILFRLAREGEWSSSLGPSQHVLHKRYEHYKALREEYKSAHALKGVAPFAGGIHVADKLGRAQDGTLIQPTFTRGRLDGYHKPRP